MSVAASLLIRQGRILLPDGTLMDGDIEIQDDRIVQVAPQIDSTSLEVERTTLYENGQVNPEVRGKVLSFGPNQ